MAAASSAAFVSVLRRYQLLEPAHLDEVEQQLAKQFLEPKALARELLQRGWLTAYQVNQIGKNHAADLRLGNYVILERRGEGGMGAVFKARHDRMRRVVALKLILKERLASPDAVKRFQREVHAAAQLNHANIVQAYDADEANGSHFLAMEYVEGADLARLVKDKGPLPVDLACDVIRQAACGLAHAHEQGLVHRDIKPANLIVNGKGVVKILDMGIARMSRTDGDTLTQEGAIVGSLDYIAPEQALQSHTVDSRADLYSLGCTFYYLLSGRVPFPGGEAMEKLLKHQQQEPVPVEQLRPEVPSGVTAIVCKLMAKDPDDRYPTPAALVEALDHLASGGHQPRDGTLDTRHGWAKIVDPANTVAYHPVEQRARRRSRQWIALAGGVVLTGLAVLAFFLLHNRQPTVQSIDQELEQLLARSNNCATNREQLRDDIVDFCLEYRGLPQAYQAGTLLPKLPRLQNSIGMQLAPIPPGKFLMGSLENEAGRNKDNEGSQHEVEITRPFYLGVHDVTVGQFRAFVKATGYKSEAETSGGAYVRGKDGKWANDPKANWQNPGFEQTDADPVVCVSWNDAQKFCDWLSQKEGKKYALPTEAQWEFSCRAGSLTRFFSGDADKDVGDYAWYSTNSGKKTHPVGQKKPNAWGLYDMTGNVRQWCQDYYDKDYYKISPSKDPEGPSAGVVRSVRGGLWSDDVTYCRSAYRYSVAPSSRNGNNGFRVLVLPASLGRVRP